LMENERGYSPMMPMISSSVRMEVPVSIIGARQTSW
jgi:hypothetical protein